MMLIFTSALMFDGDVVVVDDDDNDIDFGSADAVGDNVRVFF